MPAYDYRCENGHEWEEIHSVADCDVDHLCQQCFSLGSRIIHAAALHGAIFDKKIQYGPVTFETNAEARAYMKANPGLEPVSTTSSWWQNHKDEVREEAESQAVKQGWRDLDQRNTVQKEYREKGLESPSLPSEM